MLTERGFSNPRFSPQLAGRKTRPPLLLHWHAILMPLSFREYLRFEVLEGADIRERQCAFHPQILQGTAIPQCLRNKGCPIHSVAYHCEGGECDFIVHERGKVTEVFQVCWDLNGENRHREINGLELAMRRFGLDRGFILTRRQSEKITLDHGVVQAISAYY